MIGENIKKLRQQKGYSITELADLAGISKSYLSYIERNLQKNPSLDVLSKLAGPLNTSIDVLLGDSKSHLGENSRALGEEWRELIQRTITEGVSTGEFELVRFAEGKSADEADLPKKGKGKSNIIIFHIHH